jgi:hypothetical protein
MVPDTHREAFRIFLLTGVGLAGGVRVQEKSSTPHARLVCIHPHSPRRTVIGPMPKRE